MLYRLDRSGEKPKLVAIPPEEMAFDPARRRVVVFPGGAVFHIKQFGLKKELHRILGGLIKAFGKTINPLGAESDPPVDIYAYIAEDNWFELAEGAKRHYKNDPRPAKNFHADFSPVLWSLLLKDGETIADLDLAQMKERISHLTFSSLSVGSMHSLDAANCLKKDLTNAGWSPENVAEAVKELVLVNVGSVSRMDTPSPNPTRFLFTGSNDPILDSLMSIYMGANKRSVKVKAGYGRSKPEGGIEITPIEQGYHICGYMPDTVSWDEKLENGSINRRSAKTIDSPFLAPTIEHNFWNFLYGHEGMGRNLRNVMLNAVTREPGIGDGHQLLNQHPLNHVKVWSKTVSDPAVQNVTERA